MMGSDTLLKKLIIDVVKELDLKVSDWERYTTVELFAGSIFDRVNKALKTYGYMVKVETFVVAQGKNVLDQRHRDNCHAWFQKTHWSRGINLASLMETNGHETMHLLTTAFVCVLIYDYFAEIDAIEARAP